jgi:hypothetical protein
MKNVFFHHIGLKLISLGLAVITWYYVHHELIK